MYLANAGDCRAVLVSDTTTTRMTVDHKVTDKIELARLKSEGCSIVNGRLHVATGDINLARSFGDRRFQPHVHSVPDLFERRLSCVVCLVFLFLFRVLLWRALLFFFFFCFVSLFSSRFR